MTEAVLLDSMQMAGFVANGFLRLDAVVPQEINQRFLADIGHVDESEIPGIREYYREIMNASAIPVVRAGTPLWEAYPEDNALRNMLEVPAVAGAIQSLVGKSPVLDHHFLHVTFPKRYYRAVGQEPVSQHTHQDSTIDPRQAFDVQIMYFPHEVTADMGGTRFVPGSHLRVVSNSSIGRYQNIRGQQHVVCEAGTVLFMHMGIWHGGGLNQSDRLRYMFKIRMCPTERQRRLWDTRDLPNDMAQQRAIFWTDPQDRGDSLANTLMRYQPWYESDTGRLELMNRIRMWRYLLDDDDMDVDYWLTRVENEFA
ncbi:MAG TPA: phytanoyl-CoA dioxygenase family protein [Pseudomonadales bacterium]|nr:phytanoyl-CoA dioxygenase family protein [Pseudomonadales bacterium]